MQIMQIGDEIVVNISAKEHDISNDSVIKFSASQMIHHYGYSIYTYFKFLKMVIFINFLLTMASIGGLCYAYVSDSSSYRHSFDISNVLFFPLILSLSPTSYTLYTYIVILFAISLIPMKIFLCRINGASSARVGLENPHLGQLDIETGECINYNDDYLSLCVNLRKRIPKYIFLVRIFILLLFGGLFVVYYYTQLILQKWTHTMNSEFLEESLISIFFVGIDLVYRLIFTMLTSFEGHKYFSTFRNMDYLKSYFSRIVLFLIFGYVHQTLYYDLNLEEKTRKRANQMLNLLIVSMIIGPLIDLLFTQCYNFTHSLIRRRIICGCCKSCSFRDCCHCCGNTHHSSDHFDSNADNDLNLIFNIPEQYTRVCFNQFLTNQVVAFLPLSSVLCFIGMIFHYWSDKYRLIKLSKRPEKSDDQFILLTTIFWWFNSLAIGINLLV